MLSQNRRGGAPPAFPARRGRRAGAGPSPGDSVARISSSSAGSSSSTGSWPSPSSSGCTSLRPSAWRAASTSATRLLFTGAVSSSASRIAPRSRIETRSRSSCSSTRPTSPSVSSLGTSSSISLGWLSFSASISRLISARPSSSPGMPADQLAEMGGDHRDRIHHRVAGGDGLVFERRRDPDRGHAEGRLARLLAGQRPPARVAGDGQQLRALGLPAADLDAAQREHDTRAASGADCPRYAREAPEIPSRAERWRRSARTRFSNCPPCFSSTSGIS